MRCSISIFHHEAELQFVERVVDRPELITSKQTSFCPYPGGTLLLSNVPDSKHSVWYSLHNADRDVILDYFNPRPLLSLHIALKGNYTWQRQDMGAFNMEEGDMVLVYIPDGTSVLHVDSCPEVRVMDILISPFYLDQYRDSYDVLKPFLKSMHEGDPVVLNTRNPGYSDVLSKQADELINCTFSKSLRRLFFDARIMDLFIRMLDKLSERSTLPFSLTGGEVDRILQIQKLLADSPQSHFTIKELAKKFMFNEFKLKKGFRQVTGNSIFDFHFQVRMSRARQLLSTTALSLDDIAQQTGYEHVSSFIASFKQLYGCTPGVYRKNNT